MSDLRQCTICLKDLPKDAFYPRRRQCRLCYDLRQAEKTIERNSNKPKVKAPKAPKQPNMPAIPSPAINLANIDFTDRATAERAISENIKQSFQTLQQLETEFQGLLEQSTSREERKAIASKLHDVTKGKADLQLKLTKQFGLFSDLEKPENDNPLYTPVTLVIAPAMPPGCIVQPQFQPEQDEIQPVIGDE